MLPPSIDEEARILAVGILHSAWALRRGVRWGRKNRGFEGGQVDFYHYRADGRPMHDSLAAAANQFKAGIRHDFERALQAAVLSGKDAMAELRTVLDNEWSVPPSAGSASADQSPRTALR